MDSPLHASTLREHVLNVAQRLEDELGEERWSFVEGCQRDWNQLPAPDGPLTVGLDGGYIRGRNKQGHFEVLAGKSLRAFRREDEADELSSKCFAFVQTYDEKPKRRLFEVLRSQGLQMNQQVEFLSDGGEDVRNVQLYLNPEAEHLLDWFHITMRLTVLNQIAKGLPEKVGEGDDQYELRPGLHEAEAIAQRLLDDIRKPISLPGRECVVTASMGIASVRPDHMTPREVVHDADIAMYKAKESGRDTYRVFEPSMALAMLASPDLKARLRRAVDQKEFEL